MSDIDEIIRNWKRQGLLEAEIMEWILKDPVYKLWYKEKYPTEDLEKWPEMLKFYHIWLGNKKMPSAYSHPWASSIQIIRLFIEGMVRAKPCVKRIFREAIFAQDDLILDAIPYFLAYIRDKDGDKKEKDQIVQHFIIFYHYRKFMDKEGADFFCEIATNYLVSPSVLMSIDSLFIDYESSSPIRDCLKKWKNNPMEPLYKKAILIETWAKTERALRSEDAS